jgi:hypothetical protein
MAFPLRPSRIFGSCATVAISLTRTGVPLWALMTVRSMS